MTTDPAVVDESAGKTERVEDTERTDGTERDAAQAPQVEFGPCLNNECPFDAQAPSITLWAMTFRMLCSGCQEAADRLDEEKERQRRVEWLFGRISLGPRYRSLSLDSFPRDREARKAFEKATGWLNGFREGKTDGLILFGKSGVGKTGLAWSLIRELIVADGVEANLVIVRDLLASIRESYANNIRGDTIEPLKRVRLLCLDDVGAERPTEWAREELAALVEHRYQWELPTIYTTNYTMDQLAERLGHDDIVIGQRIVSRMQDGAVRVRMEGPDRRNR